MKELVFVYGTLKRGYGNNRLLSNATFVSEGFTADNYSLSDCGFPYMHKGAEQKPVFGELFEVTDEATMERLDTLEGVDHGHYERHKIDVICFDPFLMVEAWAYVTSEETGSQFPLCGENDQGGFEWQR